MARRAAQTAPVSRCVERQPVRRHTRLAITCKPSMSTLDSRNVPADAGEVNGLACTRLIYDGSEFFRVLHQHVYVFHVGTRLSAGNISLLICRCFV